MSKHTSITILVLITCAIAFASCDRVNQMTDTEMPMNVGIDPGTSEEVTEETTIIDRTDLGEPQEIQPFSGRYLAVAAGGFAVQWLLQGGDSQPEL